MFLEIEELKTHLSSENIELISRDDDTVVIASIDSAVAEAKSYLGDYKTDQIFTQTGTSRNPLLLTFIKDIAVWHFINLCNVGTEMDIREKRYNSAISWFKGVQKGNVSPDLPKKDKSDSYTPIITINSNPKRTNHY